MRASPRSHHRAFPGAAIALAVIASVTLGGCASDQTVTVRDSTTITKGRELSDLRRALQEGAVTEAEYERLRRVILRRPN